MRTPFSSDDQRFMHRALQLAARAEGLVEPNPMVGCVLVKRGRIVGQGYHHRYGGPHAEVFALRDAGRAARGATAYVTLEPCCHHGKTPPCTEALIAAGVKRVVAAERDPYEQVAGKGASRLRKAGIEVATGLCEREAARLMAPYLTLQRLGRPWVILKWAQSLDGKIATRTGDSKWISSQASRRRVHRLRGRVDAVLVGAGTVLADDPLLTCRDARTRRVATRVVLDPRLRTPPGSRLVRTAGEVPLLLATSRTAARSAQAARLERAGAELLVVPQRGRSLNLAALLGELGRRRMSNLLVEGGGKALGSFLDAGLADEAVVYVARRLIGGAGAPGPLGGIGPDTIGKAPLPVDVRVSRSGADDVYRLLLREPPGSAW